MSPDQRLLVYASISPVAFVVNVGSSFDVVSYLLQGTGLLTHLFSPLCCSVPV